MTDGHVQAPVPAAGGGGGAPPGGAGAPGGGDAPGIGDAPGGTGTVDVDTATFQDPVTIAGGTIHDHSGTDLTAPTVTLRGNVSPGQSPGTLSVDGNYTFATGSTFTVELPLAGAPRTASATGKETNHAGSD